MRFPGLAESQGVKGNHLVGRKAVMEFADFDVLGLDIGFFEGCLRCIGRHIEAHQRYGTAIEQRRSIRCETLARDQNRLRSQMRPCFQKGFRDNNCSRAPIRRGTTL